MEKLDESMIRPGIHPSVNLGHYNIDEERIIRNLSTEWYITHGGGKLNLGLTSEYKYFLMRPTNIYKEMFNIERDLIVVFSDYENFQSRSLDAFDKIPSLFPKFRTEKICGVLISKDNDIENKLRDLLRNEQETLVIVPFSYNDLFTIKDSYFLRNRFKKHFYTRDLFAFESPLKKDIFFFGRNDLIHDMVNRHLSNENSGLFGLRKTGKTSVLFGIRRTLEKANAISVFIDCQSPSFHRRRWFEALEYLIDEISLQLNLSDRFKRLEDYSDLDAAKFFESDILKINRVLNGKSIYFIFDEIENITFKISPTEHWCNGFDFIYFWQTLRSIFQKHGNIFTYMIVGTNPICVETSTILNKDNPIFSQIPFQFIPRFDVPQSKEMLVKLGKIMGINFDEIIYGLITEDFGGHPFLIRHLCSIINRVAPPTRPLNVDKGLYDYCKKIFIKEHTKYFDMILNVLKEHFEDEYEMLRYLARGDINTFNELAALSPELTNHLIGYGIIEYKNNIYSFRNDSIRDYLLAKEKYKKLKQSPDEMLKEISERRNNLEPKIRNLIRTQLIAFYGRTKARDNYVKYIPEKRRNKTSSLSFDELFNPNKSEIYFDELRVVILKNWDVFKNIFGIERDEFDLTMAIINKYRIDAHAKDITNEEMQHFRSCATKIENALKDFI